MTPEADTALTDGAMSRPVRALVVDDDEVDRLRLRHLCQKCGLDVIFDEAGDLRAFRRQLDSGPYDLVFIDYHLGLDTGLDALRALQSHEDQGQALAIMVTSARETRLAVEAMRAGCADYLLKEQLTVDAIRKAITSGLERRMMLFALSEARVADLATRRIVKRFMKSSGPELRTVIAATLTQLRNVRGLAETLGELGPSLTMLETGCRDMREFLDDLETIAATTETGAALRPPTT